MSDKKIKEAMSLKKQAEAYNNTHSITLFEFLLFYSLLWPLKMVFSSFLPLIESRVSFK
jgi:hypothetical protein